MHINAIKSMINYLIKEKLSKYFENEILRKEKGQGDREKKRE